MRLGWSMHRQSHSRRIFCTHRGARRTSPDQTSRLPPSPIKMRTEGSLLAFWTIHSSWRGKPIQTRRIRGEHWLIALITLAFSVPSPSASKYPWWSYNCFLGLIYGYGSHPACIEIKTMISANTGMEKSENDIISNIFFRNIRCSIVNKIVMIKYNIIEM